MNAASLVLASVMVFSGLGQQQPIVPPAQPKDPAATAPVVVPSTPMPPETTPKGAKPSSTPKGKKKAAPKKQEPKPVQSTPAPA